MDPEKENPAGEFSQSTGLSSLDATPSHPKQPKRVQIEEEPKTEDKAALVRRDEDPEDQQQQQQQPRPKRPVLDQPVIALQGREVLFAIAIFFLLAVVVSLLVIYITTLTKMRQVDQDNVTANARLIQTKAIKVKVEEENTKLKKENGELSQAAKTNRELTVEIEGLTRDLNRTCRDTRCLMAAVDLLDKMAPGGVDPCKDFWTFSCGTWIAEAEIPESREAWGLDTEKERVFMEKIRKDLNISKRMGRRYPVEEKYRTLLKVCMEEEEEEEGATGEDNPLSKILSHWNICPPPPPLPKKSRRSGRSRNNCMTRHEMVESLHFDYGIDALFDLKVVKDDDDDSVTYIKIDHASLGLSNKHQNLHKTSSYKDYIEETIATVDKRVKPDNFAGSVMSIEAKLAAKHKGEEKYKRRDLGNSSVIVSIEELDKIFLPEINWTQFLRRISTEFHLHSKVSIISRTFVEKISSLLKETSNRDLESYLRWRLVIHLAPLLSTSLKHKQIMFLYSHKKGIKTTEMKRQRYCQDIVIERFPFALLATVASHDEKINAKRQHVKDMALKIQSALVKSITGVDWMDEETAERARTRLNATKIEVGFPEFVLNETEVDRYYGAMNITEGDSFFQNVITTMKHKYEILRLRLTDPSEVFDQGWETNHFLPNVFFSSDDNLIGVTYCLLQKPFYDEDRYSFLNYASLGWKIAHEMISAMFDSDDNQDLVPDWWSNDTSLNFVNRSQCLKDYHMELVRKPDEKVVGKMSFREYVADIGGLFHSYKAYKEWVAENGEESLLPGLNLSNDKAFFVAFAQNLCKRRRKNEKKRSVGHRYPPAEEIRVRGTLSMFDIFKKVYACQNPAQDKDSTAATTAPQCDRLFW